MLNREEIKELINTHGLIKDYIDLDTQLTPNGFDFTVKNIFEFEGAGAIDFSNKERKIPEGKEILPKKQDPQDKFGTSTTLECRGERSRTIGWWNLKKGAYKIRTNETVNLPQDLIGIAFSRTSLLRMGAFTANGVWDAGFKGRSEFILVVENPYGIKVKQNARVAQLIFFRINKIEEGYKGIYQEHY